MNKKSILLRDRLALDRTRLANERTLLAYWRTAFMLLVSGFTLIKLFAQNINLVVLGYLLLPFSAFVAVFGYFRFRQVKKRLENDQILENELSLQ